MFLLLYVILLNFLSLLFYSVTLVACLLWSILLYHHVDMSFCYCMDLTITLYSYEIRYNAHKHIETTERGLVIVASHESDSGRYDCHLGGSLLCSYIITVDAHRYEYDVIMFYHNIYVCVFLIMILILCLFKFCPT